ncbi:putative esterase of the alpha-beta hydrolase superfamily [Gottschalkia purinilytica]|uniref:Putative esterase of the alpha-beta hydrolase superfamily n=1 Tax=Gottschalkia purinilytica TaxID=1503 RepID=A0A0L0W7C9_GOTPU|nr:patatin-like phospholipase family protein [Gottschalkia purinilytica]KNF07190.1 putative esterase of the alpha-beta hydrolase superfamily [Gottschalkia purinilytica]
MNGIFLKGGGAKGAFQAGAIYALKEKNIAFNVISGTSIGAINSYFIYTNNIEKMRDCWHNIDGLQFLSLKKDSKVIDNQSLIDILYDLEGQNEEIKSIYLNYVHIQNYHPKEVIVDITKLKKDEILECIKYSSLLPCKVSEDMEGEHVLKNYDFKQSLEEFKKDLQAGVYNDYKLDGGILNNNLVHPFVNDKVNKLFLIVFNKDYEVPEFLYQQYNKEDIIVIKPKTEFTPIDTLRFEGDFCKRLFEEGYNTCSMIRF